MSWLAVRSRKRNRSEALRPSLIGVAAVLAIAAACRDEPASPPDPATEAAAETPATSIDPDPEPPSDALPDVGEVQVEIGEAGVAMRANDALLSAILEVLAAAADFELEVAAAGIEDRRLTARIEKATLTQVLSLVLRGVDYSLAYRFDQVSQQHGIATLRIGPELSPGSEDPAVAQIYELLDHPDAAVVLAAIESLRAEGDPDAIPEIEPLLDDEVPEIQDAAQAALDALEGYE